MRNEEVFHQGNIILSEKEDGHTYDYITYIEGKVYVDQHNNVQKIIIDSKEKERMKRLSSQGMYIDVNKYSKDFVKCYKLDELTIVLSEVDEVSTVNEITLHFGVDEKTKEIVNIELNYIVDIPSRDLFDGRIYFIHFDSQEEMVEYILKRQG